jgi:hypothetical protein
MDVAGDRSHVRLHRLPSCFGAHKGEKALARLGSATPPRPASRCPAGSLPRNPRRPEAPPNLRGLRLARPRRAGFRHPDICSGGFRNARDPGRALSEPNMRVHSSSHRWESPPNGLAIPPPRDRPAQYGIHPRQQSVCALCQLDALVYHGMKRHAFEIANLVMPIRSAATRSRRTARLPKSVRSGG